MRPRAVLGEALAALGASAALAALAASAASAALAVLAPLAALAGTPTAPELPTWVPGDEPRAFGRFVGDRVSRTVAIDAPAGFRLDAASLPRAGRRGGPIELRRLDHATRPIEAGTRHLITLDYQLLVSPPEARTLELPVLRVRFEGPARASEVRVESWPVTVAPLAPAEPSARHGLGELRPDRAPPAIDASAARGRLLAYAALSLPLAAYLAQVYLAPALGMTRRRPFERAWRQVRGLPPRGSPEQWRDALRQVHAALDASAGHAVFEHDLERFLAERPRLAPLRADLAAFFGRSREAFFGPGDAVADERRWLVALVRRCRDAERGAA